MTTTASSVQAARWPVALELLAVLGALTVVALNLTVTTWWICLVGYVLGAVVTVVFAALYRSIRAARRSKIFRPSPGLDRVVTVVMVVGVAAGIACAYLLATEVAKW
ncbi:hypothetical protein EXU48_13945 [Occultella glacieicola]|uniref:Transmembrane protein n=1 Tax=Occultella glacieicola TaxID=2518684 RepID=A0ABY2E214_9MICO|nr:hypothetical protein [Occultella glacieicola]TDE92635.1 hypothetical protein EXU48_13945 [Occultella glacieicola]